METNKPYTTEQLKRALDYIKLRLSLQRYASSKIEDLLYVAALKIADVSQRYKALPSKFAFSNNRDLNAEVNRIIEELAEEIYGLTENTCISNVDDKDKKFILPYIRNEYKGSTTEKRIKKYAEQFKSEIEAPIAASIALGLANKDFANKTKAALKAPYTSDLMKYAKREKFSSYTEKLFGSGTYKSTYANINRVVVDQVARARQQLFEKEEKEKYGTNAWFVKRGSSYPCSLCDMQTGIHTSDFELPPFHPNCVCIAIPIKI